MKSIVCSAFILLGHLAGAEAPMMGIPDYHKIGVQNSILAKVNGTSISMVDVKKKMDLLFHQNYPQLAQSSQAKYQFYEASWRHVLMEMIDNELILADAADKEIKLTDGEIREEIESRFGPNVMSTLEKVGVSYDDAWKMVKNELVVRRMTWWFIHSKAYAKVTPQEIKQAYRDHLEKNPAYVDWKYRVITLKGESVAALADELYGKIVQSQHSPEQLQSVFDAFQAEHPSVSLQLSSEFAAKNADVSDAHRRSLEKLQPFEYSQPVVQKSRDQQEVVRLFYLAGKTDHPAASFEEMSPLLKNELLQKSVGEIAENYIGKLRKHYRFDSAHLEETLPNDMHPFSIQ